MGSSRGPQLGKQRWRPRLGILRVKQKSQKKSFQCPFVTMDFRNLYNTRTLQITASIFTITHLLIIRLDLFYSRSFIILIHQYLYQWTARVAYPLFTFVWPCIVTNFSVIKPTRCTNFTNLFRHETLHVSGQFVRPSSGVYSLYAQQ